MKAEQGERCSPCSRLSGDSRFRGNGEVGECWVFFGVFADSLLSRFCFFASVFSYLHFSRTPTSHTPHSRESGNLPVMPAEGGGFAPLALDREIPAFAGMEKGGECWFFFGVFADSLLSRFCFFASVFSRASVFSYLHFSRTPTSHTPHSRESGNLPVIARRRRGICAFGAESGDSRFRGNGKGAGMEKGGEWGGIFERWKRCGKGVENGFLGGEKK